MFQLSLERENQISVLIKIWKKYWRYSLLISLSYPTYPFRLSWISAHCALDGLEESLLGSFSPYTLAYGLLFRLIIFSFNFRTPIHPSKPRANVTSSGEPL